MKVRTYSTEKLLRIYSLKNLMCKNSDLSLAPEQACPLLGKTCRNNYLWKLSEYSIIVEMTTEQLNVYNQLQQKQNTGELKVFEGQLSSKSLQKDLFCFPVRGKKRHSILTLSLRLLFVSHQSGSFHKG